MVDKKITVEVKIGEQTFKQDGVVKVYAVDDILSLMSTDPDKVVKTFNASIEQAERASLRNEVVQKNGAPERALNKTAKQIFEARKTLGKPITMDAATDLAKQMLAS